MRAAALSRRRRQVLTLAVCGHTDKEIAAILCIQLRTVRFHFAQCCIVFNARTRLQAAALATERGLVRPRPGMLTASSSRIPEQELDLPRLARGRALLVRPS